MQAITNMYGPSHRAFLIVPLCGAFFVDLINTTVIQTIFKILSNYLKPKELLEAL